MAIDSAEKRKSLSGIQHFLIPGVTNNAALDGEWRQEAGWGYPGILVSAPVVASSSISVYVGFLSDLGKLGTF